MKIKIVFPTAALALLAGCASQAHKSISHDEAAAFEQMLLAQAQNTSQQPVPLFVQPINQKEACKLPISQEQLDRPNFRSYWDGECKNGFAYGLGRDISISDTHHYDEITTHDGTGDNFSQPRGFYDYVKNQVIYSVGGKQYPESINIMEHYDDSIAGLNVFRSVGVIDASGQEFIVNTADFQPQKIFINASAGRAVAYKFTDNSSKPAVSADELIYSAEVIDPKSGSAGGVAVAQYANGVTMHFRLNGQQLEPVKLPTSYLNHLTAKLDQVLQATSQVESKLQRVQQLEREYLFKACSGAQGIRGLDKATYSKICSWRKQFKESYLAAADNYKKQLDNLQQQAAVAAQQRQLQQQIVLQQQMLQQQQNQQVWQQINQTTQQIQQNTQQMLNSTSSWQAPQVQPLIPPGGNKVICQKIGNITTCR